MYYLIEKEKMGKLYEEIEIGVYTSSNERSVSLMVSSTILSEARARGYSCGLVKGDRLNIVVAFFNMHKIQVCWTPINLENADTCEVIAKYISDLLSNDDLYKKIMGMCYRIIELLHKNYIHKILGLNPNNYPFNENNRFRAMEDYLNSGNGDKYHTVLELITQ